MLTNKARNWFRSVPCPFEPSDCRGEIRCPSMLYDDFAIGDALTALPTTVFISRGQSAHFHELNDTFVQHLIQHPTSRRTVPGYHHIHIFTINKLQHTMSSSKGVVLVTGANGFVAGRTIEVLLKAGYSVRGTVRAKVEDRARQLREALPEYADKIEVVQLSDFAVPGSCDEAVKG